MEDRLKILKNKQKELLDFKNKSNREEKLQFLEKVLAGFKLEEEVPLWMIKIVPETILFSEFLGHYLKEDNLTTNQIRNFFGAVRKLHMKVVQASKDEFPGEVELLMLAPRIAYSAAKAPKERLRREEYKSGKPQRERGIDYLAKVLTMSINTVLEAPTTTEKVTRFDNFTNFFESIIAYHKAAGGKDSDKN